MAKELTPKHLEILAILSIEGGHIPYTKLLKKFSAVEDLKKYGLIKQEADFYLLSDKGKDYFNKVIQSASKHLENHLNSN